MKEELQNTQIALMFQSTFSGSFDGILTSYESTYPKIKSYKIPLPTDFPEDSIPRLEIQHIDENITLRFAKSRGDIFFRSNSVNQSILVDFLKRIVDLGVTVGRIGYVKQFVYSEIDIKYTRSRLPMLGAIKKDDDLLEATQKLNKKTTINHNKNSLDCNNIATLTFGKKDNKPALLLERDVNTKQDNNLGLKDAEAIQSVITLLKSEADNTIFNMKEYV